MAAWKSSGMSGSGQSLVGSTLSATVSPSLTARACRNFLSTFSQCPRLPSGSRTVRKACPFITPLTATWPRDGSLALASSGNLSMVEPPVLCTCASKRITGVSEAFCADVLSAIAALPDTDRDLHENQVSRGSASDASRFLTGLVTCFAAHGIPSAMWKSLIVLRASCTGRAGPQRGLHGAPAGRTGGLVLGDLRYFVVVAQKSDSDWNAVWWGNWQRDLLEAQGCGVPR
jgi:hypothetical protein